MGLDAGVDTGLGASVDTASQSQTGGINQITSTGASVTVTNPFGPVTNLEVAGSGFPGYGGAPPAIAAASSAGVALTVSRSDHTHAGVGSAIAGAGIAVSAATGAVTVSNTGVTSIVAGTGITISSATGAVTVNATATTFPGFGGPPPAITTASATGVAATASHSDHIHAQDLSVIYVPSQVGAQASGVFQQMFATPNATPVVTNMAATLVPFGIASGTGLLSSDTRYAYNSATGRLAVSSTNANNFANANESGLINIIREAAGTVALLIGDARASTAVGPVTWKKSRGTWAAPTVVLAGDSVGFMQFEGYDGANYVLSSNLVSFVPSDATISSGVIPQIWGFNTSGTDQAPSVQAPANMGLQADTRFNAGGGAPSLTAAASDGFFYIPAVAGAFTGTPNQVFGSTRWQNRIPTGIDTADGVGRSYAYIGGAWHYTAYTDYTPTTARIPFGGGTGGTLTDSSGLTFTSGNLNVATVAGITGSLTLQSAAAVSTLVISNSTAQATLLGNLLPGANNTYAIGAAGTAWTTVTASTIQGATSVTTLTLQNDSAANTTVTLTALNFLMSSASGWALTGAGAGNCTLTTPNNLIMTAAQVQVSAGVLTFTAGGSMDAAGASVTLSGNTMVGPVTAVFNSNGPFAYLTTTTTNPTGVPTIPFGGGAALVYDLGNQRLDLYDGGLAAWRGIPLAVNIAAGAGIPVFTTAPAGIVSLNAKWETYKDAAGVASYRPYFQ